MGVRKWLEKSAEKQKYKMRKTANPLSRKAFRAVSFSATKDKKTPILDWIIQNRCFFAFCASFFLDSETSHHYKAVFFHIPLTDVNLTYIIDLSAKQERRMPMIELESKVELYVPGTTDINHTIDTSAYVQRVATLFCQWFGGASVSKVNGYYIAASTGELVPECTHIVWSFCQTKDLVLHSPSVISLAQDICRELKQESVAVVINGTMSLVSAD